MSEVIPEVVIASENEPNNVEESSIESLNNNPGIYVGNSLSLEVLENTADEYANWVYFGVGGPA